MKETNKDKPKKLKVGNVPFEDVVRGFLEVDPPEKEKSNKNKDKKD